MNERIKELALQATDWADNQNFYESHYQNYMMTRFAKLIIRECASIADKAEPYKSNDLIKQHFGIEE